MDAIIYSVSVATIAFAGFLSLKYFDKRLIFAFGALFAIYIGLDDLVTGLPYSLDGIVDITLVDGYWNWSGKIYSLVLSLAVILALRMNAKAVGLSLPQRNIKIGLIALVPLTLVGIFLGYMFQPPPPNAETLAFQALMPSLAEEIAYRGIAPALLLGLIQKRDAPKTVPWVVICIAAVPFGVVHGLGYSSGAYSFEWGIALHTFTGGIIYGWLRFSTGSLLFPILAHSFANVGFHLMTI